MDLLNFSKETLINMIEDQQKLINEQQKLIYEQQQQITSYKQSTMPKPLKVSSSDYQVYNEDTKQMEPIDKDIVFRFGSGQIRYKKGNKYYHGLGPMENRFAWHRKFSDCYYRGIIKYRSKDHKLPHTEWDTHNADEFCCKCEFNIEESRKKLVYDRYNCLGHSIE